MSREQRAYPSAPVRFKSKNVKYKNDIFVDERVRTPVSARETPEQVGVGEGSLRRTKQKPTNTAPQQVRVTRWEPIHIYSKAALRRFLDICPWSRACPVCVPAPPGVFLPVPVPPHMMKFQGGSRFASPRRVGRVRSQQTGASPRARAASAAPRKVQRRRRRCRCNAPI